MPTVGKRRETLPLQTMFDSVHRHYDLANRVLTLGLDQRWRRGCVEKLLQARPHRVLDLCCGTGDMALWLARMAPAGCEILAVDFSEPMLRTARTKAARRGLAGRIRFLRADAAALPFPDAYLDALTLGFAFRNLTYHNPRRDDCLRQMLRVLRPGGQLVFVETCQPPIRPWRSTVHLYHRLVVRHAGRLLGGHRDAYRYLAHSAAHYLDVAGVEQLLRKTGFAFTNHQLLLGGVAARYLARKA